MIALVAWSAFEVFVLAIPWTGRAGSAPLTDTDLQPASQWSGCP